MFALKSLLQALGRDNLDCRQDGAKLDATARAGYLFNSGIAGIDQADACLLIGTDPRHEAPIINVRLRGRAKRGGFRVANVGPVLRSEEHTSELQSLMSISYAVFCLKNKK